MEGDARRDGEGATLGARILAFRLKLRRFLRQFGWGIAVLGVVAWSMARALVIDPWYDRFEKRVVVVEPGQLVRGAFQRPDPLRRIIARERIRTVVTLAAVADNPERFVEQARVVQDTGVRWLIVPILGSRPSLKQMSQAADLLAKPSFRPIFFHCAAGHHRTSLALAAYRIRHEGWSAERAWREAASYPWAQAGSQSDTFDRAQIERFASAYGARIARR
jgi:hypothetical protein